MVKLILLAFLFCVGAYAECPGDSTGRKILVWPVKVSARDTKLGKQSSAASAYVEITLVNSSNTTQTIVTSMDDEFMGTDVYLGNAAVSGDWTKPTSASTWFQLYGNLSRPIKILTTTVPAGKNTVLTYSAYLQMNANVSKTGSYHYDGSQPATSDFGDYTDPKCTVNCQSGANAQYRATISLRVCEDRGAVAGAMYVRQDMWPDLTEVSEAVNIPLNGGRPF